MLLTSPLVITSIRMASFLSLDDDAIVQARHGNILVAVGNVKLTILICIAIPLQLLSFNAFVFYAKHLIASP